VLMLTKQNAVELKQYGIRVNCVVPGVVDTPMMERAWKQEGRDPAEVDRSNLQQPEDIARAVLFFADPANTQVSGSFLAVNGVSSFI